MRAILDLFGADGKKLASVETEANGDTTILDALEVSGIAAEVPYRHSCHHGSCGTCGAVINGKEALMCIAKISEYGDEPIRVEPLKGQTHLAGIAVNPGKLFESLPDSPYLKPAGKNTGNESPEGLEDDWVEPSAMKRFEDCIECGICVSACPSEKPFIGPAALAAWDTWREQDAGALKDAQKAASAPDGVAGCVKAFECSRRCPQGVAPGKRIRSLESLARETSLDRS